MSFPDSAMLRAQGLTLIEVLVVIALSATLLLWGVPSLIDFQRHAALTSHANRLVASLNTARAAAMQHGYNAVMTPATPTGWNSGWQIFVDTDGNNTYSASDIVVQQEDALPKYLLLSGNNHAGNAQPYVSFNSAGFARSVGNKGSANLTLTLRRNDVDSSDKAQQRLVIVARSGRVRACKPTQTGCTTTSTD